MPPPSAKKPRRRRESTPEKRRRAQVARKSRLRYVAQGDVMDPARYDAAIALGRSLRPFGEITGSALFPQVYVRLLARDSVQQIAAWWHPRLGTDDPLSKLTQEALQRRLYRFRATLDPDVFLPEQPRVQKHYRKGLRLDLLDELAGAVHLQKSRIDKFMEFEEGMPLPMEQMRREVLTLSELLRQYRDTAIVVGELSVPAWAQPVIDARQVHVTVQRDRNDPPQSLEELLTANPAGIPLVMELFDQIELLETKHGSDSGGAAGDDAGGASDAAEPVRSVDVGD